MRIEKILHGVNEKALAHELEKQGLKVEQQKILPVEYNDIKIETGFRLDLLINSKLIVEIKSVETLMPVHKKQLLTYLKLSGNKLGLLINFNETHLKDGIVRIVNNL